MGLALHVSHLRCRQRQQVAMPPGLSGWLVVQSGAGCSSRLTLLSLARPPRFVMGSNKMLQVALGKTAADEYRTNLHLLSERLRGHVGLFFTTLPRDEVSTNTNGLSACVLLVLSNAVNGR